MIVVQVLCNFLSKFAIALCIFQTILRQTQISERSVVEHYHRVPLIADGNGKCYRIVIRGSFVIPQQVIDAPQDVSHPTFKRTVSHSFIELQSFSPNIKSLKKLSHHSVGITKTIVNIGTVFIIYLISTESKCFSIVL